jgi:hypothetical protein
MALVKRYDFSLPLAGETASEFSLFSQKLGAKISNESFISELVKEDMKLHIHTPCGAFHKSDEAFIWSMTALANGMFTMGKLSVTKEKTVTWMKNKIRAQLLIGAPLSIRWRTELCTHKYMGKPCLIKDCEFAHSLDELQEVIRHKNYKHNPCQSYHANYRCKYSNRCHYLHIMNPDSFVDIEFSPSEYLNAIKVDSWGVAYRGPSPTDKGVGSK